LRLEEHDDPGHPVVKLATERIEELNARAESLAVDLADLERAHSREPKLREIEAILNSIPDDMHERWEKAEGRELIDLLEIFDARISYDKPAHTLDLSVLLTSDFPNPPDAAATENWSQGFEIAGAGFEPATFGVRGGV
jgi:hypothetical protein